MPNDMIAKLILSREEIAMDNSNPNPGMENRGTLERLFSLTTHSEKSILGPLESTCFRSI